MAFFDTFKKNEYVEPIRKIAVEIDWKSIVQKRKPNFKIESLPFQREVYKLLRRTFTCLDPFFYSIPEEFDNFDDVLYSVDDIDRVLRILRHAAFRFNSGFRCMKNEAIARYLSNLSDEELIMAYIGIEYYRDFDDYDNEFLDKALHIAERVLNYRFSC